MFQDRNIDEHIRLQEEFVNLGLGETFSLGHGHGLIISFIVAGNDFSAGVPHGPVDTAVGVATRPLIAGVVEHRDPFCACVQALLDNTAPPVSGWRYRPARGAHRQPMLGLTTTLLPLGTNFCIPPSEAMARSNIASGSPPFTATRSYDPGEGGDAANSFE